VLGNTYTDTTLFGKNLKIGNKILINGVEFEVVGILQKKGSFTQDQAIYMNENALINLFSITGETDLIEIKTKDPQLVNQVKLDVEKLLRRERNVKVGEENFQVQTPQSTLDTLNSALFAVQLFVYIIAGISLVVGGIGIMNTMYTAVLERTREIGIMKAIGARNSRIFLIFFLESGFLGLVGGIIGILLGLGLAYGLAFLGRIILGADLIQASVSIMLVIGSLIFAFGLGTFFGI
jgi:putative ABC transport system permease protein